jgi:hypothetical protein
MQLAFDDAGPVDVFPRPDPQIENHGAFIEPRTENQSCRTFAALE